MERATDHRTFVGQISTPGDAKTDFDTLLYCTLLLPYNKPNSQQVHIGRRDDDVNTTTTVTERWKAVNPGKLTSEKMRGQ